MRKVESPAVECPFCGTTLLVGFDARPDDRCDCGKCGAALKVREKIVFEAVPLENAARDEKYERLGRIEEISTGSSKTFLLGNREIAVFHSGGKYFAVKNVCPHHGVELSRGSIVNESIKCPGHGFSFDLKTGQCDRDPSLCASTFEVMVHSGELFVRI